MKVALVGASGFIGQRLVQELTRAGQECVVLTRNAAGRREIKLIGGARLLEADVYDPDALAAAFAGADAAVSMAGILNEKGFGGGGFQRVHVELVEGIIAACRAAGVTRLLHLSAINAGKGESHYLRSKGEAEALLADSGLEVTVFRPSVVFGPGDSFFRRFARLLRFAPVMPLACPDARLQPVYVGDVAAAMRNALEDPGTIGKTFELAGPRVYTLRELVAWTAAALGLRRRVIGLPRFLSRLQAVLMDFVPGKPFSTDNFLSLQLDNVSERGDLAALGIQPASIEAIVPAYLGVSPRQQRLDAFRRRYRGA
ncbi:MAG: complex I NDUFA9 subunit family protein [Gammaproteobacteria bacterium]